MGSAKYACIHICHMKDRSGRWHLLPLGLYLYVSMDICFPIATSIKKHTFITYIKGCKMTNRHTQIDTHEHENMTTLYDVTPDIEMILVDRLSRFTSHKENLPIKLHQHRSYLLYGPKTTEHHKRSIIKEANTQHSIPPTTQWMTCPFTSSIKSSPTFLGKKRQSLYR